MRDIPINKRLERVMERGRLSLFARIAWRKDIGKDALREATMDEIRLRGKLNG